MKNKNITATFTRIYGISFMTDEQQTQKVNQLLQQKGSNCFYIPRKFRMNIYFTNLAEALKVSTYLNSKNDGRHYHIFPMALESLEHIKSLYEKDGALRKKKPTMYYKLTGFRVYNTASEYFDILKSIDKDNLNK